MMSCDIVNGTHLHVSKHISYSSHCKWKKHEQMRLGLRCPFYSTLDVKPLHIHSCWTFFLTGKNIPLITAVSSENCNVYVNLEYMVSTHARAVSITLSHGRHLIWVYYLPQVLYLVHRQTNQSLSQLVSLDLFSLYKVQNHGVAFLGPI